MDRLLLTCCTLLLLPTILVATVLYLINVIYKKGTYYQITKNSLLSLYQDKGKYGEFLTYKQLKQFETDGARFLFNVYIPREKGETTEIDVLMISSKGIFVFESKNYSGWIFGSENQKNWYQTLPKGRGKGKSHKEHFYNPIMQNQTHISCLQGFLGNQIPTHSIIVFSNRCTLKSVQVASQNIKVINRYHVASVVSTIYKKNPTDLLSKENITDLYNKLYPLSQTDEIVKKQHIANIQNKLYQKTKKHTFQSFAESGLSGSKQDTHTVTQTKTNPECATPIVKPIVEPVVKPIVEPVVEPVTEPVTEPVVEPVAEPVVEPVVNPIVESIAEAAIPPVDKKSEPVPSTAKNEAPPIIKCPKCSNPLVLRTASRGANAGKQFYGCSNYPKCKYIQNIQNQTSEQQTQ